MKKIFFVFVMSFCSVICFAQTSPAEALASKMAKRMKDTLGLTVQQENSLRAINMQIHNLKMQARQQHAGATNLGYYLQQEEKKRDSLYMPILSENEFLLYKQKKLNIINNN